MVYVECVSGVGCKHATTLCKYHSLPETEKAGGGRGCHTAWLKGVYDTAGSIAAFFAEN
jgi:hypothetical protein